MNKYQQKTSDLVRNGDYERAWERHCGFFGLAISEFMEIQWRLLQEQLSIAAKSRAWQVLFPHLSQIQDIKSFRDMLPLTVYADYERFLVDCPDNVLSRPITAWVRSSGRGGKAKWVPFTQEAYLQLGSCSLANNFLSTAKRSGDINIRPNWVIVHNIPPPPYLSGHAMRAETEFFDFRFIPPIEESSNLSFEQRTASAFQQAMKDGMDLIGSMTIVLVRLGEQFEKGMNASRERPKGIPDIRIILRYLRATLRARTEGRTYLLPRDIWQPKGVMGGGADTTLFRERIKHYWGVYPHETYGCSEVGIMAVQAWDHQDLTFIPSTAFYEFIPESAWANERLQGVPPTTTLLMNELEVGKRYEVVISSFYGGIFLRYRMNDLVEVTALSNDKLGIHLPQFRFVGRSGDFIDLSGFAGLIDERQLTLALNATQVAYTDWVVCKEFSQGNPRLHIYIETAPSETASTEQIANRVHQELKKLNSDYADIESMLNFVPLMATALPAGTFQRFTDYQVSQGADIGHLKPTRIQPQQELFEILVNKSVQG